MQNPALLAEFVLLFVAAPLLYRYLPMRIPALPFLWLVSGYALWRLLLDPGFDRGRLWNATQLPQHLGGILVLFAFLALVQWLAVRRLAPQLTWSFLRQHPRFWALVMAAYPILSVYPQGVLYRAFFFQRYAALFPSRWTMIVASAAAFSFVHIIFRNPLAVSFTFFGGLLFAWRYAETGSLATSALEHALYGCWLFTVGLGQYFYHGTIVTLDATLRK